MTVGYKVPAVCAAREWELQIVEDAVRDIGGSVYMEIGSFEGGSLCRFGGAMLPGARLIAIDRPLINAVGTLEKAVKRMGGNGFDASCIIADSHKMSTLKTAKSALGDRPVDVLFIDGDHSVEGVAGDVAMYCPLVREGGLVVFHDCGPVDQGHGWASKMRGPREAIRKFGLGRRCMVVQEWAGFGLIWK